MRGSQQALLRLARASFFVCLSIVLYIALSPNSLDITAPGGDKSQHILTFFLLSVLASVGWPQALRLVAIGLLVLGGSIEIAQGTSTIGRDLSLLDWFADAFGVAAGLAATKATFCLMMFSRFHRAGS